MLACEENADLQLERRFMVVRILVISAGEIALGLGGARMSLVNEVGGGGTGRKIIWI